MANYTPNLNLRKPLTGEYYDMVADHNDAMDKIDAKVGQNTSDLAETVTKADTASAKADAMASGSPKGVYATKALLEAAFPTGTTGAYLVTADGKWYYWTGVIWDIGGIYQSAGITDKSVTVEKTDFILPSSNLHNKSKDTLGFFVATDGTITANVQYNTSDFIKVVPNQAYFYYGIASANHYDANKVFIKRVLVSAAGASDVATANTYYIRVAYQHTLSQYDGLQMMNKGTSALPFEAYKYTLHEDIVKAIDARIPVANQLSRFQGKKANFLGDSITWGYTPGTGVLLANPYPTLVKNLLGLAEARNYGVSGTTLARDLANSFCTRYVDMDNDADLIFVFGGTNDWANEVPLGVNTDNTKTTFYGGLNILLSGLITKYPGKTIVFATPLHRAGDAGYLGMINYRNAVLEMGVKYGVAVLDLYASSGFYPDNTANYNAICPDGRHPNDAGHIVLANRIAGYLKTV